jgi:hypothetical protein
VAADGGAKCAGHDIQRYTVGQDLPSTEYSSVHYDCCCYSTKADPVEPIRMKPEAS